MSLLLDLSEDPGFDESTTEGKTLAHHINTLHNLSMSFNHAGHILPRKGQLGYTEESHIVL